MKWSELIFAVVWFVLILSGSIFLPRWIGMPLLWVGAGGHVWLGMRVQQRWNKEDTIAWERDGYDGEDE